MRPGAALYGVNPTPEADNPMKPVVELKARIVQIRNVERGETVGYGGTWTARRPTKLAIVSAGYADGYFRAASANDGTRGAEVVVAGKRCPIAGRISMDLMAVDVTDLPANAARRGHMVTLIGEGITVDELAHHFGTIGYEVLTNLGRRYARVYKGGLARRSKRRRRLCCPRKPRLTAALPVTVIAKKKPELSLRFRVMCADRFRSGELIADRQLADAFSGRREDGVAECRRERRHAGFADAARGHVDAVLDDVHIGHRSAIR